jgi:hypothetical protein
LSTGALRLTCILVAVNALGSHDHRGTVGEASRILLVGVWIVRDLVELAEEGSNMGVDGGVGQLCDVVWFGHDFSLGLRMRGRIWGRRLGSEES